VKFIALVTDFGRVDSYVAEMHLAIHAAWPEARILDVTHDIPPFDRARGALAAERIADRLPAGSVLVVVVDPGVGSDRKRIVARRGNVCLVAPDNGVLPIRNVDRVWEIAANDSRAANAPTTFDGRDVFVPVAVRLARGVEPPMVGTALAHWTPCVLGEDAEWREVSGEWVAEGRVVAIDGFGNAVTNVRRRGEGEEEATGTGTGTGSGGERYAVRAPTEFAGAVNGSYAAVQLGEGVAVFGSSGRMELARREAASGVSVGTSVRVSVSV